MKGRQRSAGRLMHARQSERARRRRKTVKKHHALLKKARGSSHSNKELGRSRVVVMRLLKVV